MNKGRVFWISDEEKYYTHSRDRILTLNVILFNPHSECKRCEDRVRYITDLDTSGFNSCQLKVKLSIRSTLYVDPLTRVHTKETHMECHSKFRHRYKDLNDRFQFHPGEDPEEEFRKLTGFTFDLMVDKLYGGRNEIRRR